MNYLLNIKYLVGLLASCALLANCDLQQEIDIELPEYDSRPVLECYLEPGGPFNLLLTRSAAYFDPLPELSPDFIEQLLLEDATVEIRHKGETYVLENQLRFNPLTGKLYNYHNPEMVPFDTLSPFELTVTLPDGNTITGNTRLLPVVPLDSIIVEGRAEDTLVRVLTYFTDRPAESNFYRRVLHTSSLDSIPEQDFAVDDRFVEDAVVFGTGYNYADGDTVITTIFHIEQQYYEFLESLNAAAAGNGNPFAQPSPIASPFGGTADALGIFTTLSYDRRLLIIDF